MANKIVDSFLLIPLLLLLGCTSYAYKKDISNLNTIYGIQYHDNTIPPSAIYLGVLENNIIRYDNEDTYIIKLSNNCYNRIVDKIRALEKNMGDNYNYINAKPSLELNGIIILKHSNNMYIINYESNGIPKDIYNQILQIDNECINCFSKYKAFSEFIRDYVN